jgi:hypothetical protein
MIVRNPPQPLPHDGGAFQKGKTFTFRKLDNLNPEKQKSAISYFFEDARKCIQIKDLGIYGICLEIVVLVFEILILYPFCFNFSSSLE